MLSRPVGGRSVEYFAEALLAEHRSDHALPGTEDVQGYTIWDFPGLDSDSLWPRADPLWNSE